MTHRTTIHLICSMLLSIALLSGIVRGESGETTVTQLERKISLLERQISVLRESYALARQDADEALSQKNEITKRLDALGGAALGQGEERLIETVAQLESSRDELEQLRQAALKLSDTIGDYSRAALVEDPKATLALEVALRELEVALGYRSAPKSTLTGSLNNSTVVSIDSESGLIVINAGRESKVKVGMPMEIARGDQAIAHAIVTDVRKKVAGMLIQKRLSESLSVQVGDSVSVKTIE